MQEYFNPYDKDRGPGRKPIAVSCRVGSFPVTAHSEEELRENMEMVKRYFGEKAFQHDPEAINMGLKLRAMPETQVDDYQTMEAL